MPTYAVVAYPFIAMNHSRLRESAASWSSVDLNRLPMACGLIPVLDQVLLQDAINCWDDRLLPAYSDPGWLLASGNSGSHHRYSFEAASGSGVVGYDHF